MQGLKTLTVPLSDRSYPVVIGRDVLARGVEFLPQDLRDGRRKLFMISDENVAGYYLPVAQAAFNHHFDETKPFLLPAGETSKSFTQYQRVIEWMVGQGIDRRSVVLALGGGVVGDLAGFAAATIMRGVPFIQAPTTLLSQIDSSVGGKTAINVTHGKNMVGVFYQPRLVLCSTDVMRTLPRREFIAGFAEGVKHGLITDSAFFSWIEDHFDEIFSLDDEALSDFVHKNCAIKAQIVSQDEREESGSRALLNLGHTFGHALETLISYDGRLLHGEAVGIGMVLAARLSAKLGMIDSSALRRIERIIERSGLLEPLDVVRKIIGEGVEKIIDLMRHDKKNTGKGLTLVLLEAVGRGVIRVDVPDDMVRAVLTGL